MAAAHSIAFCFDREKLIREFEWTVSEHNRMLSAMVASVRNADGFQFTELIAATGLQMDRAKCAVLKHEDEHSCGENAGEIVDGAANQHARTSA